ncbi:CCHC-type zinc finger nucleic acid binding protein-like [Gordionus sp. m RMFG-2023]|uniref:CCHC-type zinc finger nucleic acid binding protein-like n=1 Tax=Gordionus sp. m RMFG-2023 TaxID=3053472 RepID=UPI0031FCCCA8
MGKVTWLPVQELIKGWTDSDVIKNLHSSDKQSFEDNQELRPYRRESSENSRGRRLEIRQNSESRKREIMSCFNCDKPGHMLRDCREAKCFGFGKLGHIAPYCPGKQERLRCAGCGRFGHNKEECNTNNYDNKSGFPKREMGMNASNVRTIEWKKGEKFWP